MHIDNDAAPLSADAVAAEKAASRAFESLCRRRRTLVRKLGLLDEGIEELLFREFCQGADDSQNVEFYDGTFGVAQEFVDRHQSPVGMLQCVSGEGIGTGALIADDLFLTAGHVVERACARRFVEGLFGFRIPLKAAALMSSVVFDYQIDRTTGKTKGQSFPTTGLVELGPKNVDYAIVRLGANAQGVLPGKIFGYLKPAAKDLTTQGATLCIVQHPKGKPKKVHAGPLLDNRDGVISYATIDTSGTSSGAPVLAPDGEIVGVHTDGGCTRRGGFNFGVSIGAIRDVSDII